MTRITEGSGNVFEDLGLANPQEELTKAELTRQLYTILKERDLTQAQAAQVLGLKQPDVSLLMRGRYTGFSIERLFSLLLRLGRDIDIVVKPHRPQQEAGEIHILAAS